MKEQILQLQVRGQQLLEAVKDSDMTNENQIDLVIELIALLSNRLFITFGSASLTKDEDTLNFVSDFPNLLTDSIEKIELFGNELSSQIKETTHFLLTMISPQLPKEIGAVSAPQMTLDLGQNFRD